MFGRGAKAQPVVEGRLSGARSLAYGGFNAQTQNKIDFAVEIAKWHSNRVLKWIRGTDAALR